jgi:hypothetical protein
MIQPLKHYSNHQHLYPNDEKQSFDNEDCEGYRENQSPDRSLMLFDDSIDQQLGTNRNDD